MKLPVAYTIGCRQADLSQDEIMLNALAEPEGEHLIRARKRPAIDSAYTATSGHGQALFNWNIPSSPFEILVSITHDLLDTNPAPIAKSLAFTVEPS